MSCSLVMVSEELEDFEGMLAPFDPFELDSALVGSLAGMGAYVGFAFDPFELDSALVGSLAGMGAYVGVLGGFVASFVGAFDGSFVVSGYVQGALQS